MPKNKQKKRKRAQFAPPQTGNQPHAITIDAPEPKAPNDAVVEMFKLIREILQVALLPGGDAAAVYHAQEFLTRLIGDGDEQTQPGTNPEEEREASQAASGGKSTSIRDATNGQFLD